MIIGIIGPAYSGKSTVATAIQRYLEFQHVILPFAKPLKDMATYFGWDGKKDEKGRNFLQILGTEVGRCYNNNFWVDQWISSVEKYEGTCGVISDDTRFDNEVKAIKDLGGIIIRVMSNDEARTERAAQKGEKLPPPHKSEQWDQLPFDYEVFNNTQGSLEDAIKDITEQISLFLKQ